MYLESAVLDENIFGCTDFEMVGFSIFFSSFPERFFRLLAVIVSWKLFFMVVHTTTHTHPPVHSEGCTKSCNDVVQ